MRRRSLRPCWVRGTSFPRVALSLKGKPISTLRTFNEHCLRQILRDSTLFAARPRTEFHSGPSFVQGASCTMVAGRSQQIASVVSLLVARLAIKIQGASSSCGSTSLEPYGLTIAQRLRIAISLMLMRMARLRSCSRSSPRLFQAPIMWP